MTEHQQTIDGLIHDLVRRFLYYDRALDQDVGRKRIATLLNEVGIGFVVGTFCDYLSANGPTGRPRNNARRQEDGMFLLRQTAV